MKVISLQEIASRIRCRRSGKTFLSEFINQCKIEDAIIIPEGATNGDVIKALFPNARDWEVTNYEMVSGHYLDVDNGTIKCFTVEWWNAPYKTETESEV